MILSAIKRVWNKFVLKLPIVYLFTQLSIVFSFSHLTGFAHVVCNFSIKVNFSRKLSTIVDRITTGSLKKCFFNCNPFALE